MSPSELDLRAALREGEGDGAPDADRIISSAQRQQHDRRRRIRAVAGGIAAVAVIGVGGSQLLGHAFHNSSGGGAANDSLPRSNALFGTDRTAAGSHTLSSRPAAPTSAAAPTSPAQGNAELNCPARLQRIPLFGGGGTGQFGADGPLFDAPVATMIVCRYVRSDGKVVRSSIESGRVAGVVGALEAGAVRKGHDQCLSLADQYAIYARTKSGTRLGVVTLTAGCNEYLATNGTAERYVPINSVSNLLP